MADTISPAAFAADPDLADWRYLLGHVEATYTAPDPSAAVAFAAAAVASYPGRPPDVDLRGALVHLTLPARGGRADTDDGAAARTLSALAAEHGLTASPGTAMRAEIAIDALDIDAVRPFWAAALGYDDDPHPDANPEDLVDPRRLGPTVWFQPMDAIRPERNHLHIDVTVAHDEAEARVAGGVAAGGTLLTDQYAKAYWVLADPEGNEACICTWQDRGD